MNYWLLGSFRSKSGLVVLFLSQIPQWKQVHKQREKSMDFIWQLWERCLASQSVCLRWTSQSVLWCCSIALFTSASCSKPIWSEAHGVLTTISTSVYSLLGPSHSIWPLKWLLTSAERLYIAVRVFKSVYIKESCFIQHCTLMHHLNLLFPVHPFITNTIISVVYLSFWTGMIIAEWKNYITDDVKVLSPFLPLFPFII